MTEGPRRSHPDVDTSAEKISKFSKNLARAWDKGLCWESNQTPVRLNGMVEDVLVEQESVDTNIDPNQ